MENLTPPLLRALREVRWVMSSGKSMKEAFQTYLEHTQDPLAAHLRQLWIIKSQGGKPNSGAPPLPTYLQRAFWDLIERGCAGQPTMEALKALEYEVESRAQAELDDHLATLPFKALLPLLLLQFPAYLILLLGPILRELQRQIGG